MVSTYSPITNCIGMKLFPAISFPLTVRHGKVALKHVQDHREQRIENKEEK